MQTLPERLHRIAARLAEARANRATGFGVDAHKLLLNPPLTPAQLKQIETQHGLYLPDDYRAFLLHLGDGGAGPYYGITPLAQAIENRDPEQPETLPICEQGCTYEGHLVLLGSARVRVVYINTDSPDAEPHMVRDATFLDWYERWLDDLIDENLSPWFGLDDDPTPANQESREPIEIPPGPYQAQLQRIRATLPFADNEPTLSPEAIAEAEATHNVTLPPDYAAFLQEIHSGGPGPFYGLTPFQYALPDLYLAHLGLGLYAFVSPDGRVYYRDEDRPSQPAYYTTDANFLDWFERWLANPSATHGFDNPAYTTRGTPPKITWKLSPSTMR